MTPTSLPQRRYGRRAVRTAAFVLFAVCALLLFLACPSVSFAKEYTMPQVDISASVQSDGSLHVVEERTFSFDGSFSCVWWDFDSFESDMILRTNAVQLKFPERSIPEFETLKSVPFEAAWRSAGGPGVTSYSVDAARNAVYVFFGASDEKMVVKLDYTVERAAHLYDDCAELYWQYVGPDWAVTSSNVTCTIDLPAGDSTGVPGDTVRAWGHGPLDGTVQFNDQGTQVNLDVARVPSGQFAEVRLTFPREWLGDVGPEHARSGEILPTILEEESREADAANRHRMLQTASSALFGLGSLVAVVWAAVTFMRHGREHRPNFTDEYWRDVPNKSVHPVVVGRLMRWNRESSDDVVTTIMHLANLGVVSIGKGTYEVPGIFGPRVVEDYYLTLDASVADRLTNPVDRKLVNVLFGDIARNRPSLWLSEINAWGKEHPEGFSNKMKAWQGAVSEQVAAQGYFEVQGARSQHAVIVVALLLFVAGIIATVFMENLFPLAFTLLGAAVMSVFGIFMPRRSQEGSDDCARARALRNWLNDFTLLEERIPTDVKVWGEFMVYAQMFGIAKKVARELRDAVPEVFAAEDVRAAGNGSFVTWYSWYGDGHVGSVGSESFAGAFDRTLSNTLSTARTALAVQGLADAASDVAGGGGGFSGGGGGGFGGGGGGAR